MNRGRHKKQNYDAIIDRHKYKRLSNLYFTEMPNLLKECRNQGVVIDFDSLEKNPFVNKFESGFDWSHSLPDIEYWYSVMYRNKNNKPNTKKSKINY